MAVFDDVVGIVVFFTVNAITARRVSGGSVPLHMIPVMIFLPIAIGLVPGFLFGALLKKPLGHAASLTVLVAGIAACTLLGMLFNRMMRGVTLNYMLMGFLGINLDLVTSIIASVAVGVGIDYTIHFMQTFKEESQYEEEKSHGEDVNYEVATRETFKKSGSGIVTNAMAVGLGFVVLCLSQFVVLQNIGILIAIVMFTSSFLAMTIIPGLLNAHHPKFITRMDKKKVSKKD